MSDPGTFTSRDIAVVGTFFFCEVCNVVCEYGDSAWAEHRTKLKFHRIKRMLLLRCSHCGSVVIDAYAEYSPERNEFWCKNCICNVGYVNFRTDELA
jgi:hypothetical protein